MKNLDDHYAKVAAATRPSLRDLRSVVPNGEAFTSRGYGVHVAAQRIAPFTPRVPKDALNREALKLECPTCAAPEGARCLSMDKTRLGEVLKGFHNTRSHLAFMKLRKKS